MSYLYVCEQGATIGVEGHRMQVRYKDGGLKSIPIETLETIEVFGKVQLSTACIQECLKRGISVCFFSQNGGYFGRLVSPSHVNVERQRQQALLHEDEEWCLALSKRIIDAKIRNQIVIARRYARNRSDNVEQEIKEMKLALTKVGDCETIPQLMGYEGIAARNYFKILGRLIEQEFAFQNRNRRPPKDPFNSLISLGYSITMNEIYGRLEAKGLNPYFGVMHSDREKHPTLASDLMEEWRAVLVDSTAMSLLNGHELLEEHFYKNEEDDGVYLTRDGFKKFVKKFEIKMRTEQKYLKSVEYDVNFRRAIDIQVAGFIKAMETKDVTNYEPLIIR